MSDNLKLILGTMTFGPQVNYEDSMKMVQLFHNKGFQELDTAYVYNDGQTERILGTLLKEMPRDSYSLATKVHPRITGKLDGEAVKKQLNGSLQRLQSDSVDILYLHFPDPVTPVENALEACAKLYEEGKFKELGLSNYPAWMVVDIWHKCNNRGWPKPTIYQGMYNSLTRSAEKELFPALRSFGIRFYAFNPLAGGLLTGKYQDYEDNPEPGRFTYRPNYKNRYWKKSFFDALWILADECGKFDIPIVEAAIRWLSSHSYLDHDRSDGIILGASKINHLEQNISAVEKGPLPDSVLDVFDKAWTETKADSPDYFRFYNPSVKK